MRVTSSTPSLARAICVKNAFADMLHDIILYLFVYLAHERDERDMPLRARAGHFFFFCWPAWGTGIPRPVLGEG